MKFPRVCLKIVLIGCLFGGSLGIMQAKTDKAAISQEEVIRTLDSMLKPTMIQGALKILALGGCLLRVDFLH